MCAETKHSDWKQRRKWTGPTNGERECSIECWCPPWAAASQGVDETAVQKGDMAFICIIQTLNPQRSVAGTSPTTLVTQFNIRNRSDSNILFLYIWKPICI